MRILEDEFGVKYEMEPEGSGSVRLTSVRHNDISNVYGSSFIDSAIKRGTLKPVEEEETQPPKQLIQTS